MGAEEAGAMVPIGFDQTNGKVEGIGGDDDGGLIGDQDRTVVGYMKHLVKSPLAHPIKPEDPAVNPYSEEGRP